jgi:hypothetical protein
MPPNFDADPYASFGNLAVAAGYPSRSGGEIPQLWADNVLVEFTEQSVVPQITTKEHIQPLQKYGDNLTYNIAPMPTVRKRTMGKPVVYELLKATQVVVPVDQQQEWAFEVDDMDLNRMNNRWMPIWQERAGKAMVGATDLEILDWMPGCVDSKNHGNTAGYISGNIDLGSEDTPIEITKANALTKLLEIGQVLDERLTPDEDRFVVIPPAFRSCLMQSDIVTASVTGDPTSPIRNGLLGMIDRFTLYKSTRVKRTLIDANTCYSILFGWKNATAYDTVVEKVQHFAQMETSWTQAMRGLSAYARKVIWPRHIGVLFCYCTPTAPAA